MSLTPSTDLRLKVGNFFISLVLSSFPTALTIGAFYIHGVNVCHNLSSSYLISSKADNNNSKNFINGLQSNCYVSSKNTSLSYIPFLWAIIMLPTWRWFYLNHYLRVSKSK